MFVHIFNAISAELFLLVLLFHMEQVIELLYLCHKINIFLIEIVVIFFVVHALKLIVPV